jgi:hypothetical protein
MQALRPDFRSKLHNLVNQFCPGRACIVRQLGRATLRGTRIAFKHIASFAAKILGLVAGVSAQKQACFSGCCRQRNGSLCQTAACAAGHKRASHDAERYAASDESGRMLAKQVADAFLVV